MSAKHESQEDDVEDSPPKVPYRRERTPSIVVQSLGLAFNKDSNITESIELTGDDEEIDEEEEEETSPNSNSSEGSDPKSSTSGGADDNQTADTANAFESTSDSTKGSTYSLQGVSGAANPIQAKPITKSGAPNLVGSNRRFSLNIGGNRRQSLTVDYPGGNATGSLRTKVSLLPGHSLMGWIKLTNMPDVDLSGTGGKHYEVTQEELAKHDTEEDLWIALKGNVYNVTTYLSYHPGGVEEMMRGAGRDATDLFNQAHRWVNYESILDKCLIGPYKVESPIAQAGKGGFKTMTSADASTSRKTTIRKDPTVAQKPPRRQSIALTVPEPNKYQSLLLNNNSSTNLNQIQQPPTYVIMQDKSCIKIKVQDLATLPVIRARHLICDLNTNMELHLSVILSMDWLYRIHLRFQQPIEDLFTASLSNDDRTITIQLNKKEQSIWNKIGTSLDLNDSLCEMTLADKFFRPCPLASKKQLTHDTYLFEFKLDQTLMYVPIGWHVLLREYSSSIMKPRQQKDNLEHSENYYVDDHRVNKNYTPVFPSILDNDGLTDETGFMDRLYFIIKIYEDGVLTSKLSQLPMGGLVEISDYQCVDFNIEAEIMKPKHWLLFAAGTGITPFCRTISYLMNQSEENVRSVTLVYFNKTQNDIILKEQFDKFAAKKQQGAPKLVVHYVLSEEPTTPSGGRNIWHGKRGRISRELVAKLVDSHCPDELRLLACGPRAFTQLTKSIASDLNLSEKLYVFHG